MVYMQCSERCELCSCGFKSRLRHHVKDLTNDIFLNILSLEFYNALYSSTASSSGHNIVTSLSYTWHANTIRE